MEEYNYFAYFVGRTHPDGLFDRGDCGVGFTSFSPGIRDCPYGILYVIPGACINGFKPSAEYIKSAVKKYYGINFYLNERRRKYLLNEEKIEWIRTI